ncbi:hypothetical protein A3Q56_05115 [Intoshia linei]|uniref:Oxysterol-binding protein n=1 Tax=Intoshia linei TaxID=1819745 RepID=A0A177AZ69_9BILA|nr:hypothetical protein A3Q56_05115 [Intoshia linei]
MDDSQISHKSEEEIYDPNSIKKNRRTIILSKPNKSISIWSLIKGAMGKDLSRIPIPVNFSEPISMLQRVCEQFEYAEILHKAANTDNVYEQLALLASFCVSGYAITKIRNGKPFNPLLGETYECDRMADLGWKYFSEQVSHHPPITAYYVIGKGWRWWGEFSIQSTFRYNIYVKPTGVEHVEFFNTKAHYSLKKVNTTITGLMTTITIYNYGDMYITNDENMDQCHLTFENKSILRTYKYGVSGVIYDKSKTPKWLLNGTWDKYMEGARVIKMNDGVDANKVQTDPMKSIWRVRPVPDRLKECYNFTDLTVQLNEPEVGVCPTDSRLRPDQRFMENQKFDEANNTKFLLEEKQRSVRREKERKFQESMDKNIPYQSYKPLWFDYKTIKEKSFYVYNNKYWEAKSKQDWIKCPDLYL